MARALGMPPGAGPEVETIFVLLPLALLIAAIAVGFFVWAARSGQFDDLETPAVRILFDDEQVGRNQESGIRSQESGAGNQEESGSTPESPLPVRRLR
jgi:cbb3-type cytochrome oxidase maturation protein